MSTRIRLDLQTLGSQPIMMPKNLPEHCTKCKCTSNTRIVISRIDGWMDGWMEGFTMRWHNACVAAMCKNANTAKWVHQHSPNLPQLTNQPQGSWSKFTILLLVASCILQSTLRVEVPSEEPRKVLLEEIVAPIVRVGISWREQEQNVGNLEGFVGG